MIKVSDWMSKGVLAVELSDSIAVARQIMAKHRINQMPVVEGETLVGIVTDRDIRDAYPASIMIDRGEEIDRFAESYTVEEAMSYNVMSVRPQTPLTAAIKLLRRQRIGALPVVEKGKLVVEVIPRVEEAEKGDSSLKPDKKKNTKLNRRDRSVR